MLSMNIRPLAPAGGRLRVGMVGAGMISHFHLKTWANLNRAEVVCVCDVDAARARACADAFGVARAENDFLRMLDRCELDAIDIATPMETHEPLIRKAAERGLAILCQKPLTSGLSEARRLVADMRGRTRLMVHENWRFRPYYRQASEWIAAGLLGRLQQCYMSAFSAGLIADANGVRPALVREPSMRTSSLLMTGSVLIHHLDVLRYLLGPIRVVHAQRGREIDEVKSDTFTTIMLETSAKAPVVLMGNLAVPGLSLPIEDEIRIIGTESCISFSDNSLKLVGARPETIRYDPEKAYQAAFDGAIAHFVECLIEGKAFETSGDDNLETLRLVDSALKFSGAVDRPAVDATLPGNALCETDPDTPGAD